MSQLSQSKLADLKSDLDKREEAISKREKLIEERYSKEAIDVLDGSIVAREVLLEQLGKTKETLEQEISLKRDEKLKLDATIAESRSGMEENRDNLEKTIKSLDSDIKKKHSELAEVKDEIRETKHYRDEQEEKVNQTIQEWNAILVEFRKEADIIQADKIKLSGEIVSLERDKETMTEEAKRVEENLIALKDSYEAKASSYRDMLRKLDTDVSERKKAIDNLVAKYITEEQGFKARESALVMREQAVVVKERELDQKERRLKMNYNIGGLDFNAQVDI